MTPEHQLVMTVELQLPRASGSDQEAPKYITQKKLKDCHFFYVTTVNLSSDCFILL